VKSHKIVSVGSLGRHAINKLDLIATSFW